MSLQYIIDGYNLINHPQFCQNHKKRADSRLALLEFIKRKRLTGSPKNKVAVVFDGYFGTAASKIESGATQVIFSEEETADEKIKKMVESSPSPKEIVVVSDDKDIKFTVRSLGATAMGVEEFLSSGGHKAQHQKPDIVKVELNYSQIAKINQELKKRWLE